MGDLQAGLGLGPELWQQPNAAPEPTPKKQPPQLQYSRQILEAFPVPSPMVYAAPLRRQGRQPLSVVVCRSDDKCQWVLAPAPFPMQEDRHSFVKPAVEG